MNVPRLTYTEQGVHLDGPDTVEGRAEGTRELLDNLGSFLNGTEGGTRRENRRRSERYSRAWGFHRYRLMLSCGRHTSVGSA
jgi:hypothetical protein